MSKNLEKQNRRISVHAPQSKLSHIMKPKSKILKKN